jgi:heterotetrameric sarcosine oxidase gamma subunit
MSTGAASSGSGPAALPRGGLARRSPLCRRHLALGAVLAETGGWQAAARFAGPEEEARRVREGVGLADASWIGKLELQGVDPGMKTPPPASRRVWPLGRGHWLVTYPPADRDAVTREMRALASLYPCVRLTDVTSATAALVLAGPGSRDVLGSLTSLDVSERAMPDLSARQAGVAQVHAVVLRQDAGGIPAFRLLAAREYAEYFWDAVMHAGRGLGIVPFGSEALGRLEQGA